MARPNQDRGYLEKLQAHFAAEGVLPSYEGLRRLLGFRSKTAVAKLVARLMGEGFLKRSDRRLVPAARFFERPLVSRVQAGIPSDVGQAPATPFVIDQFLVEKPADTLLVPVRGDSMRDAGIYSGDIAVLNRARAAAAGDFVIAIVDGDVTLKEFAYVRRRPVLRAHNAAFKDIYPSADSAILGVVEGVIRKFGRRSRPPSLAKR